MESEQEGACAGPSPNTVKPLRPDLDVIINYLGKKIVSLCDDRKELIKFCKLYEHADVCNLMKDVMGRCSNKDCEEFTILMEHMKACDKGAACIVPECSSPYNFLRHWEKCVKEKCDFCDLRYTPNYGLPTLAPVRQNIVFNQPPVHKREEGAHDVFCIMPSGIQDDTQDMYDLGKKIHCSKPSCVVLKVKRNSMKRKHFNVLSSVKRCATCNQSQPMRPRVSRVHFLDTAVFVSEPLHLSKRKFSVNSSTSVSGNVSQLSKDMEQVKISETVAEMNLSDMLMNAKL